jgi:serine-type D-Ala-D-Ala carboxypeptidase/endopeptidase
MRGLSALCYAIFACAVMTSAMAQNSTANLDGPWLGTLHIGPASLRAQLILKHDEKGQLSCSLDSIDQGASGLPCASFTLSESALSFTVPSVNGSWKGTRSDDGNALNGTWTQGKSWPLDFVRQAAALSPTSGPAIRFQPAMAPVSAEDMQSVLAKDLDESLKSGFLAPATSAGVSIGVVRNGKRSVFAFGTGKPDSIYEVGSITKTFTGLILAQMIEQGKVQAEEPVRELLPPGVVNEPEEPEISLLDLVTQHSGLPRMPDNFSPADLNNPYVDYTPAKLYQFLSKHGVAKPADAAFLYSNLGVGLLGQALSERAHTSYADLLHNEVTEPLGLKDTVVVLSPDQQQRFIPGHTANHQPAHSWELDALAGAGAVRSTADDMLTYLEAQLHPEKLPAAVSKAKNGNTLAAALKRSQILNTDAGPNMRIAYAWMFSPTSGSYWHNGASGGYSAFAFFNPKENYAAIVLVNTAVGREGSFADLLGQHIGQRFAGVAAIDLGVMK